MKKLFLSIVLFGFTFIIFNCDSGSSKKQTSGYSNPPTIQKSSSILDKYSYVSLSSKPKEDWVGKYLKIEFDYNGGRSIAGKTKIVQLIDYEKDYEGYKFFTVKDLSDGYLQEVFFFWFGNTGGKNGFGPNIKSWKEAKPIKVQTQITQSAPTGEIDSNGNNIGEWIFYYPTGEIKKTGFYKDGEKSGKWRFFHKNEKIKYIEEYVNGAENGKWLSFDENGELVAKGFYKNGEKDGKWITDFYDNGKIHIEEFFKEGKPVGSMNVYLENGKLFETTFYSNYNYYNSFHPHAELDRMAKLAESMGIYDHNVEAYHRAIDAGDRGDVDAFVKALYDIDPTLDLDY